MLYLNRWIFDWEFVWPQKKFQQTRSTSFSVPRGILVDCMVYTGIAIDTESTSIVRPANESEEATNPLSRALTFSPVPLIHIPRDPPMQQMNSQVPAQIVRYSETTANLNIFTCTYE